MIENEARRIKLLSEEVYSKIAAGEVIDRPASIVRELIDNSIDAFSTQISVYIEKGGLGKITVIDNGNGILKDDLKLVFSKHATSKIENLDDLFKITTMGFRGEALYSIQAVSKVILTTSTSSTGATPGFRISNLNDNFEKIEEIPFQKGTKVEVFNIFYNLPARKKFLKSASSEWSMIKKVVILKALANLNIAFHLFHNGEVVFKTKGNNNFTDAFFNIFKENKFEIFTFTKKFKEVSLTFYYSSPKVFFQNRRYVEIFVNNRPVTIPFYYSSIDSVYRKYLSPGRYPLCFLYLYINPELIDVNIHPAKKEIRFFDQNYIYNVICTSLEEALSSVIKKEISFDVYSIVENNEEVRQLEISNGMNNILNENSIIFENNVIFDKKDEALTKEENDFNILGTVFDTYIVIEKDNKVIFIDQHAASEALIYKKKKRKYENLKNSEKLLIPILFDLDIINEDLMERIELLNKNGFLIEPEEGSTLIIREVPTILLEKKNYDFIAEVIKNFLEENIEYKRVNIIDEILIRLSCKEAIKKGDRLNFIEISEIVTEYFKEGINNCPHGRPVHFELTLDYLDKLFQRKS